MEPRKHQRKKKRTQKHVALVVLLTFLFTGMFFVDVLGGVRMAEATMGEDCNVLAQSITEDDLVSPKWYDRLWYQSY